MLLHLPTAEPHECSSVLFIGGATRQGSDVQEYLRATELAKYTVTAECTVKEAEAKGAAQKAVMQADAEAKASAQKVLVAAEAEAKAQAQRMMAEADRYSKQQVCSSTSTPLAFVLHGSSLLFFLPGASGLEISIVLSAHASIANGKHGCMTLLARCARVSEHAETSRSPASGVTSCSRSFA